MYFIRRIRNGEEIATYGPFDDRIGYDQWSDAESIWRRLRRRYPSDHIALVPFDNGLYPVEL